MHSTFHGARLIIGYREVISFPDWGVEDLPAKSDTGAKTSAIDVDHVERLSGNRVRFEIVLHRLQRHRRLTVTAPIARIARVRSSNGATEERYLVETHLRIGPICKKVEVSLVSRRNMLSRVLIGRSALADDFLVDARHRYLVKKRAPAKPSKKSKPHA